MERRDKKRKVKDEDWQIDVPAFRRDMLQWYWSHAREMPWRAPPGMQSDPYHEWLSEIMLQQTVVKTVIPYFRRFIDRWPSVSDLAAAPLEEVLKEWAGLGYYARARNLHKCAVIIANDYNGSFPRDEAELLKLPGIGPYTAAAISAIAFNHSATVMDGNVERVVARLYAHRAPIRDSKKILYEYARALSAGYEDHPGDFAQGMMDLGATVCTPTSPKCWICPVRRFCKARAYQIQDEIPVPSAKKTKPIRYGDVFFIENEHGELLFETRPSKGLLGGMTGLPGSRWEEGDDIKASNDYVLRHVFTHFELRLSARFEKAEKDDKLLQDSQFWYAARDYDNLALPNLYKKAIKLYFKSKKT